MVGCWAARHVITQSDILIKLNKVQTELEAQLDCKSPLHNSLGLARIKTRPIEIISLLYSLSFKSDISQAAKNAELAIVEIF